MAGWGVIARVGTWIWVRVGWKGILKIAAASGLVLVGKQAWNAAEAEYEEKKDEVQSLVGPLAAGAGILGLIVLAVAASGGRK